jgi:hypothetical protein
VIEPKREDETLVEVTLCKRNVGGDRVMMIAHPLEQRRGSFGSLRSNIGTI